MPPKKRKRSEIKMRAWTDKPGAELRLRRSSGGLVRAAELQDLGARQQPLPGCHRHVVTVSELTCPEAMTSIQSSCVFLPALWCFSQREEKEERKIEKEEKLFTYCRGN